VSDRKGKEGVGRWLVPVTCVCITFLGALSKECVRVQPKVRRAPSNLYLGFSGKNNKRFVGENGLGFCFCMRDKSRARLHRY
jgi:hypothetical protein